jgi:hypothetical protein
VAKGAIVLDAKAEEAIFLARNEISQLRVAPDIIRQIQKAIPVTPGPTTISGLFQTGRLTDNVFTEGENEFIVVEANLTANRFAAQTLRLAVVIAEVAFYVGNQGTANDAFEIFSQTRRTNTTTRADLNGVFFRG